MSDFVSWCRHLLVPFFFMKWHPYIPLHFIEMIFPLVCIYNRVVQNFGHFVYLEPYFPTSVSLTCIHTACSPMNHFTIMRMRAAFRRRNGQLYVYGRQRRECWISATERFQRKSHKYFDLRCPLSTWQAFSGRTDAPEVRCDLTDTQTDRQTQLQ